VLKLSLRAYQTAFRIRWLCLLWSAFLFCNATISAQTWSLAWNDEFDGAVHSPIDASKWQFERGDLKVNNELEFYCAPTDRAPCNPANPNAFIDGHGHLVIQALRVTDQTAPSSNAWTSARLNTANNLASFRFGRIEARIELPTGPGIWPAFWSLGTDINKVDWPSCGEMDFMESVPLSGGLGPGIVKSTIHGPGYSGGEGLGQDFRLPAGANVTTPHTYGVIWSPFMVQFYVDDPANVFFIRAAQDLPAEKQWVYNHQFFLLLNLAVGGVGSWPGPPSENTPSPARMLIDYVRAYKPSAVGPPTASGTSPIVLEAGKPSSSAFDLNARAGTGNVALTCSTDAPNIACKVFTGDPHSAAVADFTTRSSIRVFVQAAILTVASDTNRTSPGTYTITVHAYTLSSDPADAGTFGTYRIPLTVK
jgi:beta-glucanase (GH16 family)